MGEMGATVITVLESSHAADQSLSKDKEAFRMTWQSDQLDLAVVMAQVMLDVRWQNLC